MSDSPATIAPGAPGARFRVVHETRYTYQSLVTLSQQYLHLTPRTFLYQHIESHKIDIEPREEDVSEGRDYFGNITRHIAITVPHKVLSVRAESIVVLKPRYQFAQLQGTLPWESLRDSVGQDKSAAALDACRYLFSSPHVQFSTELEQYARVSYTAGRALLDAALNLTQRIFDDFEFDDKATEISTPLDEVLKGRRGVCQDFAQLMIGCLRSIGLPARYVSGYILTHPPAGQPRMIGADASHAWVSVFCSDLGWIDFDPTNRCLVQSEHITLGWGRDFSDVTPMRGIVLGGGEQTLDVEVTVTPLSWV
ncbi:transglutaminase family protein [Glaciimonas sp. Gout2]|uniref:transglutaminase family protein n=1 Tax=unclassified Glaciimonas TaxID=2644401 RepID=UPI002B234E45|nr:MULTISPECIES: transglutaminase family protein [unclassified Glaciimonas]MEB0011644.1 transglutaminase family protein [Glaciimonas sp. Cout2]MEB0081441.1 transglutaminase family protein [Glaciimonas sp. Gout2]